MKTTISTSLALALTLLLSNSIPAQNYVQIPDGPSIGNYCPSIATYNAFDFWKAYDLARETITPDFPGLREDLPLAILVTCHFIDENVRGIYYSYSEVIVINLKDESMKWDLDRRYVLAHELIHFFLNGLDERDHCLMYEAGGYEEQILSKLGMSKSAQKQEYATIMSYLGQCLFVYDHDDD